MEEKIKHLEFIQGVINRHNSNSFLIKGWTITIVAAILTLSGAINQPYLSFTALGPTIVFWILDAIFLANERSFISLYECAANDYLIRIDKKELVSKAQNTITESYKEFTTSKFSMNFRQFKEINRNNWQSAFRSNTLLWFYSALVLITIATFFGLKSLDNSTELSSLKINATIATPENIKTAPININTDKLSIDTIKVSTRQTPGLPTDTIKKAQ
jgi:hypothetical protein